MAATVAGTMGDTSPRVLIVAGEASGDVHAARLVGAIKERRPDVSFFGTGGDRMRSAGVDLLYHAAELTVVGFAEVARRYRFLKRAFDNVLAAATTRRPELAILVDYPGFNLRLAPKFRALGIPVVYFIAPQVWAWKEGRVRTLRESVDELIVVFPFEVEYFRRHGIDARYFGHPIVEELGAVASRGAHVVPGEPPSIAYLPGSRPDEISRHMPIVTSVIDHLGDAFEHIVQRAPTVSRSSLGGSDARPRFTIVDEPHEALLRADAALVKSGTSTVEATIIGTPFSVFYRTSRISYAIASRAIRVPHIAMTNLLAGREIVREFVQSSARPELIADELRRLVADRGHRERVLADLEAVRSGLQGEGSSARIANHVIDRFL